MRHGKEFDHKVRKTHLPQQGLKPPPEYGNFRHAKVRKTHLPQQGLKLGTTDRYIHAARRQKDTSTTTRIETPQATKFLARRERRQKDTSTTTRIETTGFVHNMGCQDSQKDTSTTTRIETLHYTGRIV